MFKYLREQILHHQTSDYFARTTYEISVPVLKDPKLAPEGKSGLIVSCLFDYRLTSLIHNAGWYEEFKQFCADTMIAVISSSIYPGLEKKLISWFVTTPLSLKTRTGNSEGAITGWAFTTLSMPAVHKMQHVVRSTLTPIPRFLQAGQWSYSPARLPMSFLTGKLAVTRILKEHTKKSDTRVR